MLKQFYNRGIRPNAYFWSDRNHNEVDLLIDENGKLFPFEIKVGQMVKPDFFKGTKVFNEASGNDPLLSHVIYGDESSYLHPSGVNIRSWFNLPQFS